MTDERYEIWHVSSVLSREDMLSLNALRRDIDREQGDGELPEEMPEISVSLTMVNDRIIKAVPSHLDSERFTYNVMSWQRREGHWAGVGIAEQDRRKLFERFSQVDDSPTRRHEGSGLGLYISRQLVELHGGRISVNSAGVPGEGG